MSQKIPYQLYRSAAIRKAMESLFDSGEWWMYKGQRADKLETAFAHYHQAAFGVSVSNGSVALDIALRALQIGPGDEVVLPAFDFYSLPKSVTNVGAIPVFCDVVPHNFTIAVESVRAQITANTKAVVAVHISSSVAEMDALKAFCEEHDLFLIEDCAQAHGAVYNHQKVGSFGHIGLFSFGGIKLMTSGQGGMLITSDQKLNERAYALANRGMLPDGSLNPYGIVGENFQLSELQAALLLPQLEQLEQHSQQREEAMQYLDRQMASITGILSVRQFPNTVIRAQMLYTFILDRPLAEAGMQKRLIQHLRGLGFPVMDPYTAVGQDERLQHHFQQEAGRFPNAEWASQCTIGLRHVLLLEEQQVLDELVSAVRSFLREN